MKRQRRSLINVMTQPGTAGGATARLIAGGLAFFVCVAFIAGAAFARPGDSAGSVTRGMIDGALGLFASAYASRDITRFMSMVDPSYPGGWINFKMNVQNVFLTRKDLEIRFYQDSFLVDGDKVSVELHWLKKSRTLAGAFQKTEGRSRFGFVLKGRTMKLHYITGQNPFY